MARGSDALEQSVVLEIVEDGIASGGRNGMGLIGEPVLKSAAAVFESLRDVRRDDDRAERSVAAGDSLSYQDDVGLDVPVLNSERLAGASHAGHDFVGDEQNLVLAANFSDAWGVVGWRDGCAKSGAHDRFEDEGGDGAGIRSLEKLVEVIGGGKSVFFGGKMLWRVVGKTRSNMAPFRK